METFAVYRTIVDAIIDGNGIVKKGFTFLNSHLEPEDLSYDEIFDESFRWSVHFSNLGLTKGDRLGLILLENKDFVFSFFGALMIGVIPVPLYPPFIIRRHDTYLRRTSSILHTTKARMLVTTKKIYPIMLSLLSKTPSLEKIVLTETIYNSSNLSLKQTDTVAQVGPSDTCFIQFTSGSTADPKGVIVTHDNLISNAYGLIRMISPDAESDLGVTWLPLYHDLGLVLFVIAAILTKCRVIFLSPISFITKPSIWLETVHRYRATITAAPNFGLGLATKHAKKSKPIDLSCLSVIVCGAEPINPNTVESFIDAFKYNNLNPKAIMPAYGMAEATLCITCSGANDDVKTVKLDRVKYENDIIRRVNKDATTNTLEIVSCGKPLPDHDVGIMDKRGSLIGEGQIGEIVFKGPGATKGYFSDPDKSRDLYQGKWMKTGDLGFMVDGELYVSGRKKDLIIVAGRSYHPQTIEWCVENIVGIRPGNTVAFSIPGKITEELIIVAEYNTENSPDNLSSQIRTRLIEEIGINPYDVVLVQRHTLPKTSSGKLKRSETKTAYESGRLIL